MNEVDIFNPSRKRLQSKYFKNKLKVSTCPFKWLPCGCKMTNLKFLIKTLTLMKMSISIQELPHGRL